MIKTLASLIGLLVALPALADEDFYHFKITCKNPDTLQEVLFIGLDPIKNLGLFKYQNAKDSMKRKKHGWLRLEAESTRHYRISHSIGFSAAFIMDQESNTLMPHNLSYYDFDSLKEPHEISIDLSQNKMTCKLL
jgi:hypothetical protein